MVSADVKRRASLALLEHEFSDGPAQLSTIVKEYGVTIIRKMYEFCMKYHYSELVGKD